MRYSDAVHVDTGSFYARRPELGKLYRLLGYAGVVAAWYHQGDAGMLVRLLVVLVVIWLMAWYRVVGTLWRSSVVAAIVLSAVLLSVHKLHELHASAPAIAALGAAP